jgi:predicted Zn finger-like uncharacterized protein
MFTVCPKCALTLVVTAADLRVAQGYVRCGRCSSVFNALVRLTDERQTAEAVGEAHEPPQAPQSAAQEAPVEEPPAAATAESAPPPDAGTSPAFGSEEDAIPEDALEFNPAMTDVSAVFVEPPADPQWTAATGSFKAMVAANQERTEERAELRTAAETDTTESDAPAPRPAPRALDAATPVHVPPPRPAARPPDAAVPVHVPPPRPAPRALDAGVPVHVPLPRPAPPAPDAAAPVHVPPPAHAAATPAEAPRDATTDSADRPAEEGPLARLRPYAWHAAAALAALLLLAQLLHHYRDELAASARFNRPLTALYAALGMPLVPRWDLHAYDVRQLGASVDAASAGLITVRASIKNAAQQPQPLPLLRVTLQDRFGNRIAARDVAPRFYLPHTVPESALLASGQRVDAQMDFADPGANAVGFEIDACLPARGGGVACANDPGAR